MRLKNCRVNRKHPARKTQRQILHKFAVRRRKTTGRKRMEKRMRKVVRRRPDIFSRTVSRQEAFDTADVTAVWIKMEMNTRLTS